VKFLEVDLDAWFEDLFRAAHCQSSSVDRIAVLVVVFMECMVSVQ
jgi:hypothetical protein